MEEPKTVLSDAREFARGFSDPHMDSALTEGMVASIYRIGWLAALLPPAAVVIVAFAYLPVLWGVAILGIGAPALYLLLLVMLRVGLGFALLAIRFMERLMRLPDSVEQLTAGVQGLRGDVQGLTGQVDQLRDNVTGLSGEVRGLPSVVDGLTSQVDSLYGSLESAQFWRVDKLVRRGRPSTPGRRIDSDSAESPQASD